MVDVKLGIKSSIDLTYVATLCRDKRIDRKPTRKRWWHRRKLFTNAREAGLGQHAPLDHVHTYARSQSIGVQTKKTSCVYKRIAFSEQHKLKWQPFAQFSFSQVLEMQVEQVRRPRKSNYHPSIEYSPRPCVSAGVYLRRTGIVLPSLREADQGRIRYRI